MEGRWLRVGKVVALLCSFWTAGEVWCAMDAPAKAAPEKVTPSKSEREAMIALLGSGKFDEAEKRLVKLLPSDELWIHSMLGNVYYQQGKYNQALPYLFKAVQGGDVAANICLAWMHLNGRGCKVDLRAAFRYFKYAADNSDNNFSKYHTGRMLLNGEGCREDVAQALNYLLPIAGKEQEDGDDVTGFAPAQLLLGKYFVRTKQYGKAYIYLEKAAAQNEVIAWRMLGQLYQEGNGLAESNFLWSKLCCLAAEKIAPDAENEYTLAYTCLRNYDYEEALFWYRKAAENGHSFAKNLMEDKDFVRNIQINILKKKSQASAAPEKSTFSTAVSGYFAASKKHFGTSAKEVMAQLSGNSVVDEKKPMIKIPVSPEFYIKGWNFSRKNLEQQISSRLITDRDGGQRLMYDEFKNQPLMKNLAYPNPTIRWINSMYEDSIVDALKKMPFRACSEEESQKLAAIVDPEDLSKEVEHSFWQIKDDLYFHLSSDGRGRWMVRTYAFVTIKGNKSTRILTLNTPPDADEAAMAVGIMHHDPVSLNNYAVMSENGDIGLFGGDDMEVEAIFTKLSEDGHVFGAYNLGIFYQNRKQDDKAKKCFALAERLAGSTMISYQLHRPEIFDRNGALLVKNDLFFRRFKNTRIPVNGGSFAASIIGHTSQKERIPAEEGLTGVEWLIEKKKIFHPVYLTIDSAIQRKLETLIFTVAKKCNVQYVYGCIVNSKGEMVAAAQAPYFDLQKRNTYMTPGGDANLLCGFFPGEYLLPVPDQWMKLLGSASTDDPENKVKFAFHKKIGLFPAEGQGIILGINRMPGVRDPKKVSGQSATMLRYLLAYIAHAEKKALPELALYTDAVNTPVKITGPVKWINFYRPADGIVVNALGEIPTAVPGEKLYICVRSVGMERAYGFKVAPELIRKAAESSDAAEKIIRNFQ